MQTLTELINIDYVGTFAGLTAVVCAIVQFTKSTVKKVFTKRTKDIIRLYSWIVAFAVQMFVITVQQGGFTAQDVGLAFINACLIALAAVDGYHCLKIEKDKGA